MNLAIIGPSFFGYLAELADGFRTRGVEATFYDERPSNTVSSKVFFRLANETAKERAAARYIDGLCTRILAAGHSHILLVSVEVFSKSAVQRLQDAGLIICRYGWDSVQNKPLMYSLDPLMERIASFDGQDCETYGYHYIPLYSNLRCDPDATKRTDDFFYCTTLHSDRPFWVVDFLSVITAHGWRANFLLFYHNRMLWALRYIKSPRLWVLLKSVSAVPFSRNQITQAMQKANVVLDIHHGSQTGLTMRTYEALSLGAVLLTTNKASLKYLPADIHDRIVILDRSDLAGTMQSALDCNPASLSKAQSYSLSQDRFITQLMALLSGEPIPTAHPLEQHR